MRLRFEMSGGYGGIFATRPLAYDVTLDELPDSDRRALSDVLSASGLLEASPLASAPPSRPDALTYRLTITAGGQSRRFVFDDISVPPAARPLLQHLQARAITLRAGTSPHPGPREPA